MSVDTGDWEVEFAEHFRLVRDPVLKGIEERVIGAAYGSGAYTTRDQADLLGRLLDLGEGKLLVDIGSGPGWPGNYLAASTGCRVVITDPKVEEIAVAADRVSRDGLTAYPVVASGDMLPLRDGTFDAATSGDVFCWVGDKLSVLRAIANVLRSGGRHAFLVLSFADGLSQADLAEILDDRRKHYDAGPGYRLLMEQAGFEDVQVGDATDTYLNTLEALAREWNGHAPAVKELVGEEEFNETTSRWQDTAEIVRRGLIKRYVVSGVKP